jgi:hypothetical protein
VIEEDIGRGPSDNRLSSATKPQEGLGPAGFDPARVQHFATMALLAANRLDKMAREEQQAFNGWNRDPQRFSVIAADLHAEAEGCRELAALILRDSDGNPKGEDALRLRAKHESRLPKGNRHEINASHDR